MLFSMKNTANAKAAYKTGKTIQLHFFCFLRSRKQQALMEVMSGSDIEDDIDSDCADGLLLTMMGWEITHRGKDR